MGRFPHCRRTIEAMTGLGGRVTRQEESGLRGLAAELIGSCSAVMIRGLDMGGVVGGRRLSTSVTGTS